MQTIGFLISHKPGEKRRALLPNDIKNIKMPDRIVLENGYGESLNIPDRDYIERGITMASREEVLRSDVLVDSKLGDADYLDRIEDGKLLIGWAHAVQNIEFTTKCMEAKHSVLAWEEIFIDGRYVFYRNREIAGEASIMHGLRYCGKMPYECRVAILGNGQTAKGALRVLNGLGAQVDVYGRRLEKLFMKNMFDYDIIVNCVLWDTSRKDRIIYREDLKKFKPGTLIIDISCDPGLEIETSFPTTIDDPVYTVDGVIHYSVDNTPAMFPKSVSKVLSVGTSSMLNEINDSLDSLPSYLDNALIVRDGVIRDNKIIEFRRARGLAIGGA